MQVLHQVFIDYYFIDYFARESNCYKSKENQTVTRNMQIREFFCYTKSIHYTTRTQRAEKVIIFRS